MKTRTGGPARTLVGLVAVGALLYAGTHWTGLDNQIGSKRDRFAGPERTFDDRKKHTVTLEVRYRPPRPIHIIWGIGDEGDSVERWARDRPEWELTRMNVEEGTVVSLSAEDEASTSRGGYMYCTISVDHVTRREYPEGGRGDVEGCDLTYVVGDR